MPPDGDARLLPTFALVGQLGLIMVGCILVGFLAGRYLDSVLGADFVMTVVLLLVGVAGGMIVVYRAVMKNIEGESRPGDSQSGAGPTGGDGEGE
ncbi:MAG: AtpZ/AtpI family protein [Planctomycetota bacterium]|jgi:F0F1-type ATP synthase assembly protein I